MNRSGTRATHVVAVSCGEVYDIGSMSELFRDSDRVVARLGSSAAPASEEVLLVKTRHGVFGVVNQCPHLHRRLDDGHVSGRSIECPGHGYRYDLRSGSAGGSAGWYPPALHTVPASVVGGRLFVDAAGLCRD
jgi:nitrite reductase/ring-hydroxylating ferredoxin subunit